ncbi:MAG TPA: prolyl oligopeptidase family serine peptidase, partial [Chthoniobacteraceae bacterium]|nr:prolyl oligopeptidase family serine peptidase [Chthoniobacteraceae bacterium]
MKRLLPLPFALLFALPLCAQERAGVRPIPPPGIPVPPEERAALEGGLEKLASEIKSLEQFARSKNLAGLADVRIFHKAVDWALRYDEFFDPKQIQAAKKQLEIGMQRARELREGKPSWNSATGLVVRGYVSKIDGSIQPYGLVVPDDWKPADKKPRRLDFWLHGRGEKLSELAFLEDRMKNKCECTPPGAFVLHLYGRYCCANKFAGEVDLFEALEDARTHYPIDLNRLVVRGFSMGGASAWQFATHYADRWAAAAPGAGFAETAEFFKVFAPGKEPPPWWEQVLWRWYDSTLYAANLANCPTVAYSGEIDGQKQAADIMIRYAEKEGVTIPHIIGPQTAHKYHPESKPKIEEFVTVAATKGRDEFRDPMRFVTYSLIYPQMGPVRITGMEKEWERAELTLSRDNHQPKTIETRNVTRFVLTTPSKKASTPNIIVDGTSLPFPGTGTFIKVDGRWSAEKREPATLSARESRKTPATCGPIDHAFMDRFVMVRPTGKPLNETVGNWARSELDHALEFWRRVFRGDAPVKDDKAV